MVDHADDVILHPLEAPDRLALELDALLRVGAEEVPDRDHVLRAGIDVLGDAHANRPAINVGRDVGTALMLGDGQASAIPGVRIPARSIANRQAQVVALHYVSDMTVVDIATSPPSSHFHAVGSAHVNPSSETLT
mgnify:CR=1 FL=1